MLDMGKVFVATVTWEKVKLSLLQHISKVGSPQTLKIYKNVI